VSTAGAGGGVDGGKGGVELVVEPWCGGVLARARQPAIVLRLPRQQALAGSVLRASTRVTVAVWFLSWRSARRGRCRLSWRSGDKAYTVSQHWRIPLLFGVIKRRFKNETAKIRFPYFSHVRSFFESYPVCPIQRSFGFLAAENKKKWIDPQSRFISCHLK